MILVMKGVDFSNNPNAVNAQDFPAVEDGLIGYYTGKGSAITGNNQILTMPSFMVPGPDLSRILGQIRSPELYSGSTMFKGNVVRSTIAGDDNPVSGLYGDFDYNLVRGISLTLLYRSDISSTGSNRVGLAIESLRLQMRLNCIAGTGHLLMGNTGTNLYYDVSFHGKSAGTHAITLVIKQTQVKFYHMGSLLATVDISAEGLPATTSGKTVYGSNWLGSSGLLNHQMKQFHIHNKELSLTEIQAIHAVLPNLIL